MKKLLIILLALFCFVGLIGCSQNPDMFNQNERVVYMAPVWKGSLAAAPENPAVGWAYYNTTDKCSYIYDGTSWSILAKDGTDGTNGTDAGQDNPMKFLGETTETVEGVEYTVESYAYLYANIPYYYTYYKNYYLDGKLRRIYMYNHGFTFDLDYMYTDFAEHDFVVDGFRWEFFEADGGWQYYKKEIIFNDDGKIKSLIAYHSGSKIPYKGNYEYYNSGLIKKIDCQSPYDQFEELYYDEKGERNQLIKAKCGYGENNRFFFYSYYESGYLKYYYSDGYLYSYEDRKTTWESTSEDVYSTKNEKTEDEIKAFFLTL